MADPEETKKVTNLLSYMSIVKEIEDIPTGGSSWREDDVTPLEVDDEEPSRRPYRWVMRIYESPKFPSLCADSIDIQAESVFCVADEVWKSHIYNIRCAVEAMEHKETFVVWIDYDFYRLKADPKTEKVAVDKFELGEGKQLKTRKYHYWKNAGFNLALSPAVQGFRFEKDGFIKRHGLTLKTGNLPFVHLPRDVRYVEMDSSLFFEEPWKTLELEYFKNPTRMMAEDVQKRKREEREANLPETWGNATKK